MKERVYDGLSTLTMGGILQNHASNYPEDLAIVDVDQGLRYTYKELNDRVNRLANGLLARGMRKGDLIAIYLTDRVEWMEAAFAVNKIGAVWIPCNYRFTSEELRQQLNHCEPKWFISAGNSMEVVEKLKENVASIEHFVVLADQDLPGFHRYETIIANSSNEEPGIAEEVSSENVVGIIYTSGTTGVPKGVMHTHRTLLAWAFAEVYEAGIVREDRVLNPYPMYHLGGLIVGIAAFFSGAANVMLGKFDPLKFVSLLETEKITLFMAVPTIVHAINSLPQGVKEKHALSSVTRFFTSSAPLFSETKEAFMNQWPHMEMISAYTSTEMFFTTLRHRDQLRKKLCVGRPTFGSEIKVMDKSGNELPKGQAGLVYGRGMSRFAGYHKNPEANQKSYVGDWFTCEDIGYLDEEGYLYLIDRDKDMIISGGENIASTEVENMLLQHPAIFECAVIGVRDEQWGEQVQAVVSLRPGHLATPEEIIAWCKGRIAGYKQPREIHIMPDLPKNPVGKILKRELRDEMNQNVAKT